MQRLFVFISLIPLIYSFGVCSTAFANNGCLPSLYTCDGQPPTSPPISWNNVGLGTATTFALLMDDPTFEYHIHWFVANISITTTSEPAGVSGTTKVAGTEIVPFNGPCGGPDNDYRISVFALPTTKTTFNVTNNITGNVIYNDLLNIAQAAASMRVTYYRNSQLPANATVTCPAVAMPCNVTGTSLLTPASTTSPNQTFNQTSNTMSMGTITAVVTTTNTVPSVASSIESFGIFWIVGIAAYFVAAFNR